MFITQKSELLVRQLVLLDVWRPLLNRNVFFFFLLQSYKNIFVLFIVTGKQRPKGITSNQHGSKDGNDGGGKIPAEKPAAKTKKSANLPTSTIAGQEEPASNVKKKPRKIKSAIKAGAPECTGLSSAKAKTPNEDRRTIMNKKRAKEQEHVDEVQNHTEPQLEVQSTSTGTGMIMIIIIDN